MPVDPDIIRAAVRHLRKRDAVLRRVIDVVGPFTLTPHRDRYRMLVGSIISQQISGKAARSIRQRLEGLIAPARMTAERIADLSFEQLRGVGLSSQKASYLHDLSAKIAAKEVRLDRTGQMTDDEVIAELTQVKGIGVWTAQMYLMFSLGRLDVFPHADFGIRSALRNLYGLADLPDKETSHRIADPWRPYATVASWYCWRSLEVAEFKLPGGQ